MEKRAVKDEISGCVVQANVKWKIQGTEQHNRRVEKTRSEYAIQKREASDTKGVRQAEGWYVRYPSTIIRFNFQAFLSQYMSHLKTQTSPASPIADSLLVSTQSVAGFCWSDFLKSGVDIAIMVLLLMFTILNPSTGYFWRIAAEHDRDFVDP